MNRGGEQSAGIYVVGLGAATAIGEAALSTAAAARAGIAGFAEHPYMINRKVEPYILARAPYLDVNMRVSQRLLTLATSALREAMSSLAGRLDAAVSIPLIMGLPSPRPGLVDNFGADLTMKLGEMRHSGFRMAPVDYLPQGHSAGLIAVEKACQAIRERRSRFCLAGGVDSYIDSRTLDWLERNEQVHELDNAWGFIPGEASAFCLLCDEATAEEYQLPRLCRIVSVATENEANRIKTDTVCVGTGLTKAFRRVLPELPTDARVNHVFCDQNGEAYRADEYGFTLMRTNKYFVDGSDFTAPADCWGDVGAASGPLFILLAATAARKGYAKGPWTLAWTSSESGERSSVLIHADAAERGAA